jgi:hypothetical protein
MGDVNRSGWTIADQSIEGALEKTAVSRIEALAGLVENEETRDLDQGPP